MNKTRFLKKNNYFRAALYIKLIVDNVKYRGIQCDFGRLTKLFFVTPDSLLIAFQRDTDFFQYTNCGRAFNPGQKSVLNKASVAVFKCSVPPVKENSTVFLTIKPSAKKITPIAEGRISGSQAKRACLTIRVFNN